MRHRAPGLAFRLAGARAGPRHRGSNGDAFAHGAISAGVVRGIYAKSGSAGAVGYPEQNRSDSSVAACNARTPKHKSCGKDESVGDRFHMFLPGLFGNAIIA